jgi:hypothetical protein
MWNKIHRRQRLNSELTVTRAFSDDRSVYCGITELRSCRQLMFDKETHVFTTSSE